MKEFLKGIMDNEKMETRKERDDKLIEKWQVTGLLEGIEDITRKRNIARLFENEKDQLKVLMKETTSMAGGDVQGFAAVAFPIIRRVFGDLVSVSDLASVQTMDQPVGMVFVMDFTAGTNKNGMGFSQGSSFYGGNRVASQIVSGVDISSVIDEGGSLYNMNAGYSSPSGTVAVSLLGPIGAPIASGVVGAMGSDFNYTLDSYCQFDVSLSGSFVVVMTASKSTFANLNAQFYAAITDTSTTSGTLIKRLTRDYPGDTTKIMLFYSSTHTQHVGLTGSTDGVPGNSTNWSRTFKYPVQEGFNNPGYALSSIGGTSPWGYEFDGTAGQNDVIPEVDLRIDSFEIRTNTKMLRAKWTAQLSQDLNAWQNIDAEVELTSFLAEEVALEIDVEVIRDLVQMATGAQKYWSRRPGRFLNRDTGEVIPAAQAGDFTGNISEWYQSLIETINDASAQMSRKVLKGGATYVVCGPEVQGILETTNQWFASTTVGEASKGGSAGIRKEGSVQKKWDVFVTPYFWRNLILLGRKGNSNLETGYVYAPYVPLITSPTVPNPDNLFVYTKGVMTRYGKRMIRPDYWAKVVVLNLLG